MLIAMRKGKGGLLMILIFITISHQMKKQNQAGHSDSRKRVDSIFEEEQALSKAFQIGNFYTNQRLNIAQLKQRLQQFKKTQKQPPNSNKYETPNKQQNTVFNQLPSQERERTIDEQSTAKFANNSTRNTKEQLVNLTLLKRNVEGEGQRQTINLNGGLDRAYSIERKEEARQANYRIVRQIQKGRYETKIRTAFGSRHNQSIQPLANMSVHDRVNSRLKKGSAEKTEQSKFSDSSHKRSWSELGYEGRIKVETVQHLNELEKQIHHLWEHYQLITKILLGLRLGSRQEKNTIVKYVEDICSDRFEFIRDLLNSIHRDNASKTEMSYTKRIKKAIIQSKLYQNLSLVYVSLDICLKHQPDSHLVNFVGYCSSNVIFLLRFVQLSHQLCNNLKHSQHTESILAVIEQFEEQSYKCKIQRMGDLILRIEHNNEVIGIVQQRICSKMNKEFQQIIVNFLKNVDMDTKPLLQYAHYIYQFLAFHLARLNLIGQFSFVEMAPTPYLNLPKQKTLVIEPWEVLFAMKGESTYIRAYSESLLSEVAKHWNIVYWTDLMPDKIDDLLEKLPQGSILYRYHCRYQNDRFLKLLWRIGCDVENTIIIDRDEANFKYDRDIGIELPWSGKSKDSKLMDLLNLLLPLFQNSSISLRKSFPPVKEHLSQSKRSRQRRDRAQPKNESIFPRALRK